MMRTYDYELLLTRLQQAAQIAASLGLDEHVGNDIQHVMATVRANMAEEAQK